MALPVAAWVLTTTFSSIPREVQEAAAVDGSGAWRTLTSIILPLALPGLAVCGLLVWLLSWEEFTLATYLTLVEHFVSPCQAKPLVDGKVEADKTAVRTVSDAG